MDTCKKNYNKFNTIQFKNLNSYNITTKKSNSRRKKDSFNYGLRTNVFPIHLIAL